MKKQSSKKPASKNIDKDVASAVAALSASGIEGVDEKDISKSVVATGDGNSIKVSTKNKASGEIPESERTRASIEAMKKLEAEEAEGAENDTDDHIKESAQDLVNQMGLNATIITSEGIKQEAMAHSILPEDISNNPDEPNMIDSDPISGIDKSKDKVEDNDDIWLNLDDAETEGEDDDSLDHFIEI